jgi:hypothetical protein
LTDASLVLVALILVVVVTPLLSWQEQLYFLQEEEPMTTKTERTRINFFIENMFKGLIMTAKWENYSTL